jgi:hypothetical protein
LRNDAVLTRSENFPSPDENHACLVRAGAATVDDLIREIIDYFTAKGLTPTVFASPACTPADLPRRLISYGFASGAKEAWMTMADLSNGDVCPPCPDVFVRQITKNEVMIFASTFLEGSDMPLELAPRLAHRLEPSFRLPGVHYYLICIGGKPAGTYSLIRHRRYGILGSAAIVPGYRRKKVSPRRSSMPDGRPSTRGSIPSCYKRRLVLR